MILGMSGNSFIGFDQAPNAFPWRSLQILNLSNNKLQGALSIPPPSILYYSVSNNMLTGDISQMICELSSLSYLDVSYNNLSGFLPHYLGDHLRNLSILNLHTTTFMAAFLKYSWKDANWEWSHWVKIVLRGLYQGHWLTVQCWKFLILETII